jgi:hypothetical protein
MRNLAILVSTAALLAASASHAADPAEATASAAPGGEPVMAAWVEKKVDFPYKGLTSYYSCDGIRLKVSSILKMIGAREGFKVDVRMCPNYPRPENMPWVHIIAAMPQPATPELLAELAKPDAKRELVARVKGQDSPVAEPTAQFPARWEQVRIVGKPTGPVQVGDCELIDEMARMAFVQLGARIVENTTACVPKQVNPGSVRLTLEVLKPVPQP